MRGEAEEPPRRGVSPLVVAALMAAGGLGVYAAMRISERERPAPMPVEASPAATETGAPAPPATAERAPAEAPSRAPTTSTLAPLSAGRPDQSPAAVRSAAAGETSPSPTAMEEAWSRASALLDPPLQEVAAATSALVQDCAVFAYACLSSTGGNCLLSMRSGTIVANNVPRLGGGRADCDLERQRLIGRADAAKAQLDRVEAQARANGVLPGHWRRLLAAHGLELWYQY